jgi:hypothetical protein
LRSLVARGLVGVQLAISDAHPGLKAAIARVLGSPWQRCTVHFLRDLHGHCRKDQHDALGALIRQIFTAADSAEARRGLAEAIAQLEPRLPKIARLLDEAEDDILAFYAFPSEHWPKLRSTNPLERFNREIGRRTDVVGILPDDPSLIRLVSMLAIEANDEWLVGRSYISQGSMATLYESRTDRPSLPDLKRRSPSSPPREHQRLHRRDERLTWSTMSWLWIRRVWARRLVLLSVWRRGGGVGGNGRSTNLACCGPARGGAWAEALPHLLRPFAWRYRVVRRCRPMFGSDATTRSWDCCVCTRSRCRCSVPLKATGRFMRSSTGAYSQRWRLLRSASGAGGAEPRWSFRWA